MGKSTISMAIFNCYVTVHQRVDHFRSMNLQDPLRSQKRAEQDLAPPEALISLRAKSLYSMASMACGSRKIMGKPWEKHGKINDDRIFVEERLVNFPICDSLDTICIQ